MAAEAVAPTEVSAKVEATKEETAVAVSKNASFREESNFLADLKESERKVLAELRDKVEAAIVEGKLFDDGKPEEKKKAEAAVEKEVKEEAGTEEKKEEVESKEEAKAEEKAEEEDKTATDAEETKEEAEDKKEEAGACEKVAAATDEEKTSAIVVDQDISARAFSRPAPRSRCSAGPSAGAGAGRASPATKTASRRSSRGRSTSTALTARATPCATTRSGCSPTTPCTRRPSAPRKARRGSSAGGCAPWSATSPSWTSRPAASRRCCRSSTSGTRLGRPRRTSASLPSRCSTCSRTTTPSSSQET
jgi:hypothetical protein